MDIKVLIRNPETGDIERTSITYSGSVPENVWKNLNRRLLKYDAGGRFFPGGNAMDAYQEAIRQITESAKRLESGEIVLKTATDETYLTSVGYNALKQYILRKVQPNRDTYRSVEDKTVGRGAVGEDGFDIDNHNGAEDHPRKAMKDACNEKCEQSIPAGSALTAQELVQQLHADESYGQRQDKALNELAEIVEVLLKGNRKLGEKACDFFAAFIVADGNKVKAAQLIAIGKTKFYEEWPRLLAAARKVAEKTSRSGL